MQSESRSRDGGNGVGEIDDPWEVLVEAHRDVPDDAEVIRYAGRERAAWEVLLRELRAYLALGPMNGPAGAPLTRELVGALRRHRLGRADL